MRAVVALVILCTVVGANAIGEQSAFDLVKSAEGVRRCTYTDTTGHKTIGIGYNLDQPGARQELENVGANFDQVVLGNYESLDTNFLKGLQRTALPER